jgi:Phasin protein
MTTQPKPPGGKPQGTTPPGATQRKLGNQKAPKKVAAEQTGAAKREEIAQKASAPAGDAVQKAKASRVEASHKVKAKTTATEAAKKAKAPVAEAAQKVTAAAAASVKKAVSSMPVPELSKDTVSSAMETIEESWKAAGLGTVAVNRKILDFARQNVSSGLHLARSLAGAKNPVEMARLHVTFWDEQMKALASQAEELRAMSAELVSKAAEPLREHMRKSFSDLDRYRPLRSHPA